MAKKKFGKVLLCSALIGSAVAGGMALYNKYKSSNDDLDDDDFLDFDDDDFDDDEFDDDFDDFDDDDDSDDDVTDTFDDESSKDTAKADISSEDEEEVKEEKAEKSYVNVPSGDDFASSEIEAEKKSNDIGFDSLL